MLRERSVELDAVRCEMIELIDDPLGVEACVLLLPIGSDEDGLRVTIGRPGVPPPRERLSTRLRERLPCLLTGAIETGWCGLPQRSSADPINDLLLFGRCTLRV